MLIHDYFTSPEYAELSPRALKALIDLYCQFRGNNNGDLCAAWSLMSRRGWTSKDQLAKAITELLERRWIELTRQGGRRIPSLYAVTWLGIDDCGGKLDVRPNSVPTNAWKCRPVPAIALSLPRQPGQSTPPDGAMNVRSDQFCPTGRVSTWG